jgi:hypothetical protein
LHFGPDDLVAAAWADLGQVRKLIMIEMIAGLRMTLNSAAKMKLRSGNSVLIGAGVASALARRRRSTAVRVAKSKPVVTRVIPANRKSREPNFR